MPVGALAQQKCATTLDCAQQAVDIAAQTQATVKALNTKIDQLAKVSGITVTVGSDPAGKQTVGLDKNLACPPGQATLELISELGGTCSQTVRPRWASGCLH